MSSIGGGAWRCLFVVLKTSMSVSRERRNWKKLRPLYLQVTERLSNTRYACNPVSEK